MRLMLVAFLGALSCACVVQDDEHVSEAEHAITGGELAAGYPEAALVDAFMGANQVRCSGIVISPHVVVTSAICLWRFGPWRVTVPFAGGQSVVATGGAVYDFSPINPRPHNLGVVFLPTPITLPAYPRLAAAPVADGTQVVRLGRSRDDVTSDVALFVSAPVAVASGEPLGLPFEYVAAGTLEGPDQGGGVERADHELVAINTNDRDGLVSLTRVDLVATWLREQMVRAGDAVDAPRWIDMTGDASACHEQPGVACGWSPVDSGMGYTCAPRHPGWAEPWTCELGPFDPGWVDMSDDPGACANRPGLPCGWSSVDQGAGYTCALRHPAWANGWTCEP
jgi:hypothetical protein